MKSFLFISVGEAETDDMKGGKMVMEKTLNEKAPSGLVWKLYYTPGAVHQNNAQLSAANGIKEWGEYMKRN